MNFDIEHLDSAMAYRLLASVVVPRPIALVSSLDENGEVNAAPFSFFNLIGSKPPVVVLGISDRAPGIRKDTRANIEHEGEFVVNLVDEALAAAMNVCGIDFPAGVSEMEAARLTPVASMKIKTPRIAESPVQIECRLSAIVPVGENRIVLAEVVALHIRDEFINTESMHVRTEAMKIIGRMHGGGWYARTTDLFDMPRLSHARWLESEGQV